MSDGIKVDGVDVDLDIDSELTISDVGGNMSMIAAQISYWGRLWAAAEREKEQAESSYRYWRAQRGKEILDGQPKLPEWRVRQEVEATRKFLKYKYAISEAIRNVVALKATYESFKVKASMLQSKGAMMRSELDATGMVTPAKKPSGYKKSEDKAREYTKSINKKKKAKS